MLPWDTKGQKILALRKWVKANSSLVAGFRARSAFQVFGDGILRKLG
jgi:hypothetical protein